MSAFKSLAAVLLLVGVSSGSLTPSFRFAYQNPEQPGGIAQFYNGPDAAFEYNWGYQFPGRAHSESKTYSGVVEGSYAFVDANGAVQQATYKASPDAGFNVDQKVIAHGDPSKVVPVVPLVDPSVVGVHPQQYSPFEGSDVDQFRSNLFTSNVVDVGLDSGSVKAINDASPTLLAAVRSGYLKPLRGENDHLVFEVSDFLIDQAQGSVSALATILDTDVVAARHDQQVFRGAASFYNAPRANPSADRAVLETDILSSGNPGYVVKIPYVL